MAQKSPEEDPLVDFLRQYRPSPPRESPDFESRLMNLIDLESQESKTFSWRFGGLIGATLCTGLLLFLGGFRASERTAQQARLSDQELEAFVIDTWDGTMGEPMNYYHPTSLESAWQVNPEPHLTYSTYQP
ncbi:MAG: hypothetical protein N5P05_001674 [Chroococcopsis gigantea SAG 12.99]|jgi:hypothetical protein|nr:hypothetical protein [Chroococcopsis gigantea SAG 12.99]